ncbi:MmgE/PrpD family protein [Paracoccus laeviglucosivorans]|uniref:2-methylcitrate dehydratase PrpD n=1 Tax=Paracoccus laeviglucosivorans TaxID=1197861 RepID=A0A521FMK0_9RHOB|nr:MmgE/PrpD family protein [Paracoccus laeviglucosivorans]SMO96810.1 2-methylcitrate dehydratase PrpD [Paracoccus laeviglucosivorans]
MLTRDFLQAVGAVPITDTARDVAALAVADALAIGCAAVEEPGPKHLIALAKDQPGPCHVLGHRLRLAPAAAARINGALIHVLDYEPMWNPANHAISTTLPGLLALTAIRDVETPDLLDALARGIETQARLRLASRQFEPGDLVLHPPGVVGPIGAAVACGTLMRLTPDQMATAVGIAASSAGGILANVGSMTKALHCGRAAASGLEAALLAARGFSAHPDALAGPRGFVAAYFGAHADLEALTSRTPLHLLDPGPAWKLYPAQYGTQFLISAGLKLFGQMQDLGLDADRIVAGRITAPVMPYVDRPAPVDGLDGKFSMQYGFALALLDGQVGLASYSDAARFRPQMQDLLPKITLHPDPERQGRFDRMRVEVEIAFADGRRMTAGSDGPDGIWSRPLQPGRLQEKLRDCLTASHGADAAQKLSQMLLTLNHTGGPKLRAVIDRLEEDLPCPSR